MKKWGMLLAAAIGLMTISGCSKYEEVSVTAAEPQTEAQERVISLENEPDVTEEETKAVPETTERTEIDGKIQSYLTGEMVDVSAANRRPIAIMMSNDKAALPQYGINRAGVVYEAPVEGGMNRYMAVIEEYDGLERIGSVRSCRTYYTYFAREFEAIYAHFGQSVFALPYLERMEHLNGIEGKGSVAFYRSSDKKAPHNAYASAERIEKAIDASGYSREYPDTYEGHYLFASEDKPVLLEHGFEAWNIRPGYPINNPWFEYHPEDGLYYRYQYGAAHKGNEGQIAVKNIIFQYCHWKFYSPSEYLDIDVHTPCTGYYFTNGRGQLISWKKDGELGVTKYYDENGQEIRLNPGKTWVCIIQADQMDKAEFYGEQTQ